MLFITFCWAGNIVAGKFALRGFGPVALTQLREAGTALLLGILFFAWRGRPRLRFSLRHWIFLCVVAVCGTTVNQLSFISGVARTSVANTALIVALGPVIVLALSCLARLEALTLWKSAGMLISFVGVVVLTVGEAARGGGHWTGNLILLVGTASFSYYTILVKKLIYRLDALSLNFVTYALGALFMVPFGARALLEVHWASAPAAGWYGLAYMILFGSVIGYVIYAFALTQLTASRVAAFGYLQPVIAAALGVWILAESLTLRVALAGAMILLGVYLTERERGEERDLAVGARELPSTE